MFSRRKFFVAGTGTAITLASSSVQAEPARDLKSYGLPKEPHQTTLFVVIGGRNERANSQAAYAICGNQPSPLVWNQAEGRTFTPEQIEHHPDWSAIFIENWEPGVISRDMLQLIAARRFKRIVVTLNRKVRHLYYTELRMLITYSDNLIEVSGPRVLKDRQGLAEAVY